MGRLEYDKDLEPPNEHKVITGNLYLYKVLDLKHVLRYMEMNMLSYEWKTPPYKLSENNKYAYLTVNLKGCGIYPEHADEILFTFYDINTLT